MYLQHVRRAANLAVISAVLAATSYADADVRASRRDADLLKQKVVAINQFGARPSKLPRRTTVTENEVNAYLTLDALNDLPVGVLEPSVTILGSGRLSGRAVVDLDAVRRQSPPRSLLDPRNLLIGRLPVTATGVLTAGNGVARFSLESAAIGGLPMPKIVLQEILSYYSRTPDKPDGISLDGPFDLPSNIREIQVDPGQAIIIQ
jgi:hypothetical protein